MKTHKELYYRIETRWPKTDSWGYLPEHEGLTKGRAREVYNQYAYHLRNGMQMRMVETTVVQKEVPVRGAVIESYLLGDWKTELRRVTYDARWHLVQGKRYKRISHQRASALLKVFMKDPFKKVSIKL